MGPTKVGPGKVGPGATMVGSGGTRSYGIGCHQLGELDKGGPPMPLIGDEILPAALSFAAARAALNASPRGVSSDGGTAEEGSLLLLPRGGENVIANSVLHLQANCGRLRC